MRDPITHEQMTTKDWIERLMPKEGFPLGWDENDYQVYFEIMSDFISVKILLAHNTKEKLSEILKVYNYARFGKVPFGEDAGNNLQSV